MNSQGYICTSLEWNGPIYDIFSSVRLIRQTNRHFYKIALNTKIQLQTFFSTTSRKKHYGATRKNDFFTVDFGHGLGNEIMGCHFRQNYCFVFIRQHISLLGNVFYY